jgi:serine phosphatase RsbU (regulator of sigma subunit)
MGHIAADVRRRGIRAPASSALDELEAFYLHDETRRRLSAMGWVRRVLYRIGWLVKSLLLKLTPIRRILLAVGLFLLVTQARINVGQGFSVELRDFGLGFVLLVLMLELKDKLVARHELEAGRAVQLALMPAESPPVPGWDLWLYTQPANDVGGDLVDYLQVDAERYGVALGDVAGKALPAALLMVKLQATLRALVPRVRTLDELATAVNEILVRDGLPNRFATLVYLLLSSTSGHVRVLNAGHMPPAIVRRSAEVEELPGRSVALGMLPEMVFAEQGVDLSPGDVLVVYSDGVTEAMNAREDFFGEERLRAALRATAGQPVAAIGRRVLSDVREFVGDAPMHDDLSLVVVRRRADPGGAP